MCSSVDLPDPVEKPGERDADRQGDRDARLGIGGGLLAIVAGASFQPQAMAGTQLVYKADRRTAWKFLEHLLKAVPYRIHTILTDNGIEFAEQPRNRNTAWSRQMRLDLICEANNIEHRLTKPIHPKAMITILPEADWNGWLTSSYEDVISLQRPYLAKRMRVRGPVF